MTGDYSRRTFDKLKNYSGVQLQQGRVLLDADWNEQWEISQHRLSVETMDVIGRTGAPKHGESFCIGIAPDGTDLLILPGRLYVDGLLFELEKGHRPVTYFHQPYYPDPDSLYFISSPPDALPGSPPDGTTHHHGPMSPPLETGALDLLPGTYVVYLKGWQREITWLEDPHIQETALGGGVDTSTRIQNIWQVHLLSVTPEGKAPVDCDSHFPEWKTLIGGKPGLLQARTSPAAAQTDPCCLPPSAGYLGLENQLYRVEVQTGGTAGTATFKWSRENASVATKILDIDGDTLTLADFGKDDNVLNIGPQQWVEIVDEYSELHGKPNSLVQILDFGRSPNTVILTGDATVYKGRPNLRLRRWDMPVNTGTAQGLATNGTGSWLDLENGIQVAFGNGQFNPGDYWLITARLPTASIEWPVYPDTNIPMQRPPVGVGYHYCKLAVITAATNGQVVIQDCRPLFPPLTGICAEDVCFDDTSCQLSGATNVQEALDLLCAANDLRDHNKYLHGYGVVCGLTMNCGPDRQSVLVNTGYALDCNGNIINLKKAFTYPLVAKAANVADIKGGKVLVSLSGSSSNPVITLEPYTGGAFWQEVLEGTLIKDFVEKYILGLIKFAEQKLGIPIKEQVPVPLGQRKLTSLLNVLAQLLIPANGRYVFLSGQKGGKRADCPALTNDATEDELLYCLYRELQDEIGGKTFCGIFDGDPPFPDYKVQPGLSTIFGTPFRGHQRMQVSLDGQYAYTVGEKDNKVHIYDLKSHQLVQILEYTPDPNVRFVDIADVPGFTHLYVVGLSGANSVFAVLTRTDGAHPVHGWGWNQVVNGVQCVKIATDPKTTTPYGIFRGLGVFDLSGLGGAGFTQNRVGAALNTTGLLAISGTGTLLVSANTGGPVGSAFNNLVTITLADGKAFPHPFIGDANNDDAVETRDMYWCTGRNGAGERVIGGLAVNDQSGAAPRPNLTNDKSVIMRLGVTAEDGRFLFLTCSDTCRVLEFQTDANIAKPGRFRIPVQISPVAIAMGRGNQFGYVLNAVSNTITVMDFEQIFKGGSFGKFGSSQPNYTKEPPAVLAAYNQEVLAAFKATLSHLLQFLKDGFCGEFLIDCPTCSEKDKIYLGVVELKDGQVYHICNLTKRKYVKTFRTVDWWLSTVPVLPIVKQLFANFACKKL